ncbi:MAG: agmatinase [Desulfatitalea sp.]|nr:agmatinase [Desulfatitalea sp.]NNK02284.1 agmatinase [Desulfatitalea sp.]
MTPHPTPFLMPPEDFCDLKRAQAVVVPFAYEGGVSYGLGAAGAPQAVLAASRQVEYYDEVLDAEPYRVGLGTVAAPLIPDDPVQMLALLETLTDELLAQSKFPVVVGGDHSITSGFVQSVGRYCPEFGVIQLDAHADLRDRYEGSPHSHACVMARIREMTSHTLQIGIRSMAAEEARRVKRDNISLCTMRQWRLGQFDICRALAELPPKVFITLDVDVFDWSVVASTGTPEPGGFGWQEMLDLLMAIFETKQVVGVDVVELAHQPHDINSAYAVAKLIYKIIGFKFAGCLQKVSISSLSASADS